MDKVSNIVTLTVTDKDTLLYKVEFDFNELLLKKSVITDSVGYTFSLALQALASSDSEQQIKPKPVEPMGITEPQIPTVQYLEVNEEKEKEKESEEKEEFSKDELLAQAKDKILEHSSKVLEKRQEMIANIENKRTQKEKNDNEIPQKEENDDTIEHESFETVHKEVSEILNMTK